MAPEIPFGVQKELITPRLAADATAAHWVLLALCDARILFPWFFFLLRERFFWGFYTCFPGSFSSCEREVFFWVFYVLRILVFSRFFL